MKLLKINLWMGILVLMILGSCREDITGDGMSTTNFEDPVILIQTSIKGRIVDEGQLPIQDVLVDIDGQSVFTDENGFFEFEGNFNKNGTYITATKNGYFLGAKVVNPHLGTTSYTQIKLLTMELTGSFASSAGGTITTTDGAEVFFPSDAIADANGNPYSGTVDVFVKWIDPTSENIDSEMPGDLRAIDLDDENVQLATYGMLAVELRSNTGAELNLAENKRADLSFPLPAEYVSNAPSTIPLWSFNEDTGYWEEEGVAELDGGFYKGKVSHFSFWNCDAPFPLIVVSGNVQTSTGESVNFLQLTATVEGIGTRYGYLDSDGNFSGKMPKNEIITIKILDYCGNELFSADFGPYTEDTDIGVIVVEGATVTSLSGRLVDCVGDAVTNGYAFIESGNFAFNANVNDLGEFNTELFLCEDIDATVTGYDLDELLKSEPITVVIDQTVDLGDIQVCEDITEFIKITVDDPSEELYIFEFMYSSFEGETYFFGSEGQDSTFIDVSLNLDPSQVGSVNVESVNFFGPISGTNGIFGSCASGCNGATADVSINEGVVGRVKGMTEVTLLANGPDPEVVLTIEWDLVND